MTALLPLAIIVGGDIVGGILAGILFMISPALAGIVRLLTSLVGLGGLVLLVLLTIQMVSELKSVTRNQAFAWWPMLVPFYNLYWVLVLLPQEVTKAKQILGVQAPTRNLVLYFFLYPYALASDLNDMVR